MWIQPGGKGRREGTREVGGKLEREEQREGGREGRLRKANSPRISRPPPRPECEIRR